MGKKLPIEDLVAEVIAELERLKYSYNSISGFRAFYKRVIVFANEKKEIYFTEELGRNFLKDKYELVVKDSIRKLNICI